jgi:hypothetical protein
MQLESDDQPLFSKNELREIRLAMAHYLEENEDLRSKVILMDTLVKKREAALKQADRYIKALEQRVHELQGKMFNQEYAERLNAVPLSP